MTGRVVRMHNLRASQGEALTRSQSVSDKNKKTKDSRTGPKAKDPAAMSYEEGDWLGEKLRATYDDILREPLPDEFESLLESLEKSETQKP